MHPQSNVWDNFSCHLFLVGQQALRGDPCKTCQLQLVLPRSLRTLQFQMDTGVDGSHRCRWCYCCTGLWRQKEDENLDRTADRVNHGCYAATTEQHHNQQLVTVIRSAQSYARVMVKEWFIVESCSCSCAKTDFLSAYVCSTLTVYTTLTVCHALKLTTS